VGKRPCKNLAKVKTKGEGNHEVREVEIKKGGDESGGKANSVPEKGNSQTKDEGMSGVTSISQGEGP